jgi:L-fuculose-phosphate aldolase
VLLEAERAAVVEHCLRMAAEDLTVGTSGNVSVRSGGLVAITPSGVAYEQLTPEGVCVVDLDGRPAEPGPVPSSEVPLHLAIYHHTGAGAVVHTHPLHATAISTLLDELPPIHYMIALMGGPVRVAPYATYGSAELASHAITALEGRSAVIHANHGATTHGADLPEAFNRSRYLEWLCRLHHQASLMGTPRLLAAEEIERVATMLRSYGQGEK